MSSSNTPKHSDGSLVRAIRSGDEEAASDLFNRYIGRLNQLADRRLANGLAKRVDRTDVTQSVFRTLFRRIGGGQYDVPPGETIWQLLASIALNKIRSVGTHHTAAKRDIRRSSSVGDHSELGLEFSRDESSLRILELTVDELMERLTEDQRQIIAMRMEEHDVATIASETGRSKRTVERVLQGFRADLRRVLKGDRRE